LPPSHSTSGSRIDSRILAPKQTGFCVAAATGFEVIASPGAYIIGGSMYAVGRLGQFCRVADLGLHGTEAVLVATR